MRTLDLVVRADCALVDGVVAPAAVAVRDGVIVAVAESDAVLPADREIVAGPDSILLPGLVDTHVHVDEPGRTEWEGFATATAAAAAGGVTTMLDMPLNSIPATVDPDALRVKQDAARPQALVDVGFWGGAVPSSLGHLRELWDAGVYGFKCFLAPSGVAEFPHLDVDRLEAALAEVASFGGLLIVHAEDAHVLEQATPAAGVRYADYVASRPEQAELASIGDVIDGVRRTGARAHILHLSSAAALPMIAEAKADGLPLTVETCPHYLVFDDAHIPDGATQYKCAPPIRSAANRDELWQGLVDGVIDSVVSDHSPATRELKLGTDGDFGRAWGGISGLQVGLPAVWTEARRRGIGIEHVVRWMSAAPAELVGLTRKGGIEAGKDADLILFAPDEPFTVDVRRLEHRNPVSAYDGAHLHGIVRRTLLRGADVGASGSPRGALLSREVAVPTR